MSQDAVPDPHPSATGLPPGVTGAHELVWEARGHPGGRRPVTLVLVPVLLLLGALVTVGAAMVGVNAERALSRSATGELTSGEDESQASGGRSCCS